MDVMSANLGVPSKQLDRIVDITVFIHVLYMYRLSVPGHISYSLTYLTGEGSETEVYDRLLILPGFPLMAILDVEYGQLVKVDLVATNDVAGHISPMVRAEFEARHTGKY